MNRKHLKLSFAIILGFASTRAVYAQEKPLAADVGLVSARLSSIHRNATAEVPSQLISSLEHAKPGTVSLDALIAEALEKSPEVLAARRKFDAATKRPSQVSTLPEPRFSFVNFGVGHPASTLN